MPLVSGNENDLLETLNEDSLYENLNCIKEIAKNHTHPGHTSLEVDGEIETSMSADRERQENRSISLPCPHEDCSYETIKAADDSKLEALVKLLSMHLRVNHGQDTDGGSLEGFSRHLSKEDKAAKELEAATAKREIKKVIDDATLNLCEARFFSMPLNKKVLAQNMPVNQYPVNTVVDLTDQGVNVTHPELLRKLHSRAQTGLRLRDCSDTNLKTVYSSGDELVPIQAKLDKNQLQLGRPQKQLDSIQEAVRALHNYCILARNFHPLDTSQQALFRVVLEMYLNGRPTVQNVVSLFEKFIHENAVRAHKKEVPLSYKEILDLWNTYIVPSVISRSTFEDMIDEKLKKLPSEGKGVKRGASNVSNMGKKLRRVNYCPDWNKSENQPFCTNQQAGDGCHDAAGNFFVHACSKKLKGAYCNSSRHNIHTH